MANPQPKHHTRISNELAEAFARIRIPGESMQIFWVIFRKTYGFHKKKDKISTNQFMQLTGLSRGCVYKARRKLKEMNLITIYQKVGDNILTYSIQKDYDKWNTISKKVGISKKVRKVSTKKDLLYITKENQKKTTAEPSETRLAQEHFYNTYKQRFEKEYIANFAKDGKILKDLLKTIPLEEVCSLIDKFFKIDDEFVQKTGYTIGVFKSQINKLRTSYYHKKEITYA